MKIKVDTGHHPDIYMRDMVNGRPYQVTQGTYAGMIFVRISPDMAVCFSPTDGRISVWTEIKAVSVGVRELPGGTTVTLEF